MVSLKYGSLEDSLKSRSSGDAALQEGIRVGNVNVGTNEVLEIESTSSGQTREDVIAMVELRRKARSIQVSTDDLEVKAYLRQLGEPICLYGEDAADRRERLRQMLALLGESALRKRDPEEELRIAKQREQDNTVWYHEGPESLKEARQWIAEYSLPIARDRIAKSKEYFASAPESQRKAKIHELRKQLHNIHIESSQIGDNRPLSYCQFSPDSSMLATSSWSGLCKLWSVPDCQLIRTYRGHDTQVGCIVWHPRACGDPDTLALASCSHDGAVKLWTLESEEPLADMEGHEPHRVSRIAFHPSGRFLATACYDYSWRMWDLQNEVEILHQEGHSRPVYDIAFHPDGSLVLTGALDSYGRVWDLRTGRCIMFMEGHQKSILAVTFAANGYHMATGGEDNSVKVWDLRQQTCLYTIPAHTNLVAGVKFQPQNSNFLLSTSYDGTAKIWGHPVWTPIRTLGGHEGKVMYSDISLDNKYIATCSFDRTFKLWTHL